MQIEAPIWTDINKGWDDILASAFFSRLPWYYLSLLAYLTFFFLWRGLRKRKSFIYEMPEKGQAEPLPIRFAVQDYLKAGLSIVFLFMRLFHFARGFTR